MTSTRQYQICTHCILDTNDYPEIVFDEKGICNICHTYDDLKSRTVFTGDEGKNKLSDLLQKIHQNSKGKKYDCILAISGGTDSTYLAWLCKQWGLNPLALHVDNGWNSELAVRNIEHVITKLGLDLYTWVIDWEELKDLQLAYFKSNVLDLDIPSENALLAAFYFLARKYKLKYIITGHNTVTEGWLPPNFTSQYKMDTLNLRAIQKRFGTMKLKKYPSIGFFHHFWFTRINGIHMVSPLNYVQYDKQEAKDTLLRELGWRDYGTKHYENIFTRFYQGYILPVKYGVDKRKAHYSTLICSGQMTRAEALEIVSHPPYQNQQQLQDDREFLIKKLGMTADQFEKFMQTPAVSHETFPSYLSIYAKLRSAYRWGKKIFANSSRTLTSG